MDDNKDRAYLDYQVGMKYKDIAQKYRVSLNTVKSWKKRYAWTREKGAHKIKRVHTKGVPLGNRNAEGHGPPKGNRNAVKFGFFSKYLPEESLDIMNEIQDRSPADMIWDQIMIQYTAIIRAQKIMLVQDHDDMTKEENMYMHSESNRQTKSTDSSSETEQHGYLIQFAWDKQANFLIAQSKAMAELRNLIKQFVAIADEADERRMKLRLMQAQIKKLEVEANEESGGNDRAIIVENVDEMRQCLDEQDNQDNRPD